MLRSGVAVLLHRTTPVPGANAQLRRFCADLGRLLVASRPAESYDEGPGHPRVGESRKWASHALYGAFLAGFRVRTPQSAWHAPEDLSRASERIRRISRQMCRNRLLPVVVWVRFIGDGTLGRCLGPDTLEASFSLPASWLRPAARGMRPRRRTPSLSRPLPAARPRRIPRRRCLRRVASVCRRSVRVVLRVRPDRVGLAAGIA